MLGFLPIANLLKVSYQKIFSAIILIGCLSTYLNAQNDTDQDDGRYQKELSKTPSFSIYGDNYFVTGTRINESPNSQNSDAKYQLGFKQIISRDLLPFDTHLFFTYQQISFWDIYQDSFPFRDTNYNPSIGLGRLLFDKAGEINGGLWFAFEHQSNGRDEEDSRSWNYFSLLYYKAFSDKFHSSLEAWAPIGTKDGNQDLLEYIGYGELTATWRPTDILFIEGKFRKALRADWRGSAQISVNLRYSKRTNQFLYLQYFVGQGESMLDYQMNSNFLRIGIVFKDLLFWD